MEKKESTTYLFEQMPIPGAVAKLAVPMVITNLVTIVYNLADTFFVGMLNDPVQNAAVTLVYPVILAFYAEAARKDAFSRPPHLAPNKAHQAPQTRLR